MFLAVLQRKRVIVTKRKFTINVDFKIPPSVSLGVGPRNLHFQDALQLVLSKQLRWWVITVC